MRNLLFIAVALITFQVTAQKKEKRAELKKEKLEKITSISAKERAQLETKKMTLHLDLTDAQQQKVNAINLKNAEMRLAKAKERLKNIDKTEKPSQEERLKLMNERLDAQIATKREMKAILNAEQMEKWEKLQRKRGMHKKRGKKKRKKTMRKEKNIEKN
ncbi:hypothetical protein [uncultured Lacinutrix sp.]|uniref:hypothetical protein n=1 Tax=uncultured Lacinutrix sp. TaxID=574032 RepID=UPI0026063BB7|nr:hypothetical protein [uncultured Lacinutrix sp.]